MSTTSTDTKFFPCLPLAHICAAIWVFVLALPIKFVLCKTSLIGAAVWHPHDALAAAHAVGVAPCMVKRDPQMLFACI